MSICLICAVLFAYFFVGWSQSPSIIAMDRGFFMLFDGLTQRSWAFDTLVVGIFVTNTFKVAPLLVCLIWLFFENRRQGQSTAFVGLTAVGSLLAMVLSRLLQNLSAFRPRPLHNPDIVYQLPHGIETTRLEGWSSFPSDTTALTVALGAGVFLASWRLGLAAFVWILVVVAFPRAYAGLHYPSDLIGGALIGLFATFGAAPILWRAATARWKLSIPDRWMPWVWAVAFLYLYQIGTMFNDVRSYGFFAKSVLGL